VIGVTGVNDGSGENGAIFETMFEVEEHGCPSAPVSFAVGSIPAVAGHSGCTRAE
jgi:hypothetical protein